MLELLAFTLLFSTLGYLGSFGTIFMLKGKNARRKKSSKLYYY